MYCATIKEVCKAGDVVNYRLHFRSTAVTSAGTRRNVPTIFVFHHLCDVAPATRTRISYTTTSSKATNATKKINYIY